MRVAVTGAAGFLGRAIASRLTDVRPITRETDGDLLQADLPSLVEGCDVVVNCAALADAKSGTEAEHWRMNAEFPVALAVAAKEAGVRRFVQISSVIAITSPDSRYGKSKLAADSALMKLAGDGFSVAALRPPPIFGPGAKGGFSLYSKVASRGFPLPIGRIDNSRSFAYVGNVADAVVRCLDSDRSGTWVITDSSPLSSADLYRKLLVLHGYGDRVLPFPALLLRIAANAVNRERAESLLGDAAFDGSCFASAFNWSPPTSFDEGLRLTVAAS